MAGLLGNRRNPSVDRLRSHVTPCTDVGLGYRQGVKRSATNPSSAPHHSRRFDRVDALRGVAVLWMTLYHFAFDLNHFGHWRQDFYTNPVWTWQRTAIVSLFLFCAGLGQAIAVHQGQGWPRFWRRWAQVAGCAVLVSAGSALMFPRSFIFFGVLHGIALMLVLALALALVPLPSMLPLTACVPLALNATAHTLAVWPIKRFASRDASTSHTRTLRSAEATSARLPSGANATALATFPCASSGSSSPVLSGVAGPFTLARKRVPSFSVRTSSPKFCTQDRKSVV